jgi:transposase
MVCTRVPHESGSGRRVQKTWSVAARFAPFAELADHLRCEGIERVVLEAASDYWRIWFYLLEAAGLQVWLVSARDVKNVPARPKTGRLDSVWLCKLNERGMLRPSFVPRTAQFPTAAHACAWAKLSPQTRQSGARTRPGTTGKGNRWLRGALGDAAMAAGKTDTYLGERYRRIRRRRGRQKSHRRHRPRHPRDRLPAHQQPRPALPRPRPRLLRPARPPAPDPQQDPRDRTAQPRHERHPVPTAASGHLRMPG